MANVLCPNCGESYHETTDAYSPGVPTTGNMLRLKKDYSDNGWTSFPEHEGMKFGDLECPGCGGQYSVDGRVRVDMEQWGKEYIAAFKKAPGSVVITAEDRKKYEMDTLLAEYDPEVPTPWNRLTHSFDDGIKDNLFMSSPLLDAVTKRPGRPKKK